MLPGTKASYLKREQKRPLIHKKCKTSFAQCKFMSCWKPSGNLASIGTTKKQMDYPSFHHRSDSYKAQNLRKSLPQNLFIKGLLQCFFRASVVKMPVMVVQEIKIGQHRIDSYCSTLMRNSCTLRESSGTLWWNLMDFL